MPTTTPTMTWDQVLLIHVLPPFLAMCGVIIASWLNNRHWNRKQLRATKDLHEEINGKMERVLISERASGKAEGMLQEKERQDKVSEREGNDS
jgi:hypothetical protein